MTAWLLLLLGVVLTVGTALFVAAEFSLVALDRPDGADAPSTRVSPGPGRSSRRCAACPPSSPAPSSASP